MPESIPGKTSERDYRQPTEALPAEPALRPTLPEAYARILTLQRLAGNQAVGRLLEADLGRSPAEVDNERAPVESVLARSSGQPLDPATRAFMESRFGHDLGHVRIFTDTRAAQSAQALAARAYTVGRAIVFGAGQYEPHSQAGRRLLAHELAHVVQQQGVSHQGRGKNPQVSEPGEPAEHEAETAAQTVMGAQTERMQPGVRQSPHPRITVRPGRTSHVQRQPAPQQQQPARGQVQAGSVNDAIEYLETMARFLGGAREFVMLLLEPSPGQRGTDAQRRRAHTSLNQERISRFLRQAKTTYEWQLGRLPVNDPLRVRLRAVYVQVLGEIRRAADTALNVSETLDAATRDPERLRYAENMAAWIEASPMTAAGLVGTTAFQQADVAAGANYEAVLEAYLDDLLRRLPGLNLTQAQRDDIYNRVLIALRRAFVTVAAGPSGAVDVRAITNPQIAAKYQQVVALLAGNIANAQQMSIITDPLPAYQLPNPVPNVTQQLAANPNIGAVDVTRVPPDEVDSVRFGILQAANTVFAPGSTIQRRNAFWPVTLQIRQGANVVPVRYELVFDNNRNVRAERLGEARARDVAPAFAQLGVAQKKAQLVQDFGLTAVDDRPQAANRPAANWTGPELDQVKAAFDLIPQRDRDSLRGVTLVRDHQGPVPPGGLIAILLGFFHTGPSAPHDQPGPPAHNPPHIHYYDDAFRLNALLSVGAPGATGPGGDWTLLHEVGHARIGRATRAANAAVQAANQQLNQAQQALQAAIQGLQVNQAQQQAWNAWNQAQGAANQAIVAFNQGLVAAQPVGQAQQAQLLQAAQAAVQARNQARAGLAAANLPQGVVQAASNLDAANDALLAASQQIVAAQAQIPTFVALAGRFGFRPFTDYARRGGNDEWFAETYALYLTDPTRLHQMNRNIFLWFEAGMPMDPNWNPAP